MKCRSCNREVPSVEWVEDATYCDMKNPYLSKNEISCAERVRRASMPVTFLTTSSRVGRRDITAKQ